ncbi:MAG: DUF2815 family protein [Planctomycetaceae bacterium]|nr:DUF2815 family protein [Planctomycetaceae bacterium]
MTTKTPKTRVITRNVRLSFPYLFKPKKNNLDPSKDPRYTCDLLLTDSEVTNLKAAAQVAIQDKWGGKPPAHFRSPFKSGDELNAKREDRGKDPYPEYAGMTFISPWSEDPVGVVDQNADALIDKNEIYAGCFVNASVTAVAYDKGGNAGVFFALNNVQKHRDGDPFGPARISAENEFGEVDAAAAGASSGRDYL